MAVQQVLQQVGITDAHVAVGEIHLAQPVTAKQQVQLGEQLSAIGLELIDSRNGALIEKVKKLVIKRARNEEGEKEKPKNLSVLLTEQLHLEYTYLSSLFSSVEGRTIENYFIEQRIEKAKELLVYGELTLSEIAFRLNYSSVAHLSAQFKKVTGLTPSHFKQVGTARRQPLDKV